MAIRTSKVGDGITERETTSYSGEDIGPAMMRGAKELNQALAAAGGSFFELNVLALAKWCDEVLRSAQIKPGEELGNADSLENYASRMRRRIEIVRSAIKAGKADQAARFALDLGKLITELELKCQWESHALRGQKSITDGRRGHETVYGSKEEHGAQKIKRKNAFERALAKGKSRKAAKIDAGAQCGVSIRTIERSLTGK